jgi:hypothetical protein
LYRCNQAAQAGWIGAHLPTRPQIFFIASPGGCATLSLARAIDQVSPQVKCFHGDELYGTTGGGKSGVSEIELIEKTWSIAKSEQRVVGSVHSIAGHWARQRCLALNGSAAAIFRHPIKRTLSILRHYDYTRTLIHDSTRGAGQTAIKCLKNIYRHENFQIRKQDTHKYTAQFNFLAVFIRGAVFDGFNWIHFKNNEKFKFEAFTTSNTNFFELVKAVLPEQFHDPDTLRAVWPLPRLHNRSTLIRDEDIVAVLNSDFDFTTLVQHMVFEKLEIEDIGSIADIYENMGYPLYGFMT